MPASLEPGEATPAALDHSPVRRARPGRRVGIALVSLLAVAAALVVAVLATRGSWEPTLERADVGTIAGNVVEKAIEDLRSAPATSAVVYQQILPSLVEIETSGPASSDEPTEITWMVAALGALLAAAVAAPIRWSPYP